MIFMPQLKIQYRDPNTLSVHPAIKHIPALGEDELKPIRAGLKHGGEALPPLLVTEDGSILNDTSRTAWLCAKKLQHKEVPVCICAAADVHVIILRDVICRRHLSKGAQLYLCIPAIQGMIKVSKEKALDWANKKASRDPSALSADEPKIWTLEYICEELNLKKRMLEQAIQVRKEFEDTDNYPRTLEGGPQDGEVVEMNLKAYYEPKLLQAFIGGEHDDRQPLGLGAILAGIGADRVKNKGEFSSTKRPNRRVVLCMNTFSKILPHHAGAWAELDAAQRRQVLEKITEAAEKVAPETADAIGEAFKEIAKIYTAAAKAKA